MSKPELRAGRIPELALVAVLAAWLAPYVLTSYSTYDEFTYLGHALRLARGEVIYRDFFEFLGPLSSWVATALFTLTGPSLLAARLLQAGLLVLSGWQLFHLARRLGTPAGLACLPGLLLVLCLYPLFPIYSHHWLVLPLELAALGWALTGTPRAWAAAGAACGLTVLCLQTDGLVLAVALGLAVLGGPWVRGERWRPVALAALAGGALVPLGLAVAWLAAHGALGAAIDDVWRWPLAHYRTAGGVNDIKVFTDLSVMTNVSAGWVNLPFWYVRAFYSLCLLFLAPGLALVGLAWAVDRLWERWRADRPLSPTQAGLLLLVLLATGDFLAATRGRADSIHVGMYALPALLLGAVLADRWARRFREPGLRLVRWLPTGLLVAFGLAGAVLDLHQMRAAPELWLRLESPDKRLAAMPALAYLRSHGRPGDRLIGFPMGELYSFYGWPSASSYSEMLPPGDGYHTQAEYQAFWAQMLARRPRFVVYQPFLPDALVHAAYFQQPLTGYHLAATLPAWPSQPELPAYIYERDDAVTPPARPAPR